MDRIRMALEKVKRSPATLDGFFKKYFEMDAAALEGLKGGFHELLASRLTLKLRDGMGCINQEIEQEGFRSIAAVIRSCPEKYKPRKKGSANANTSA